MRALTSTRGRVNRKPIFDLKIASPHAIMMRSRWKGDMAKDDAIMVDPRLYDNVYSYEAAIMK